MRVLLLLGAALVLPGCQQSGPPDCERVLEEIDACIDGAGSRRSNDLVKCIPMQDQEEIEGTWAQDFEFNEFYENQRLTFEQALRFPDPSTKVWPVEGVEEIQTPGTVSVLWVRFIGRRPVCEIGIENYDIWLENVLEYEVIEERPSQWPS